MTTLCPYCKTQMSRSDFDNFIFLNMESYGNGQTVATPCCGKGIRLAPVVNFSVIASIGDFREDNWGNDIAKSEHSEVQIHDFQMI